MTALAYTTPVTVERPDDSLTVSEVAALLGRTTDHVRTLIHSGRMPGWLDERDRNYRVRRADAEAYREGRLRAVPTPMFAELGGYADRLDALEEQRKTLVEQRNRAMLRWRDERGASVTAIAKAARLGRQHATDALKIARAEAAAATRDQ